METIPSGSTSLLTLPTLSIHQNRVTDFESKQELRKLLLKRKQKINILYIYVCVYICTYNIIDRSREG